MDAAKRAVDQVDAAAITVVKGYAQPPPLVVMVMEAIMIFIKQPNTFDAAKKEMQNAGDFLKKIKAIEVAKLSEKDLKKVRTEYLEKKDKETKKDVWDIAKIQKVSAPAGNLAAWAKAMSDF